jgi:hypothetical protein
MFTPQPVHGAAVYLLRFVTHDWPDAEVQLILRELARAASPDSKLLLIDFVVQSTCREEDTMTADSSVPGVQRSVPPVPLLQTAGEELALMADIMVRGGTRISLTCTSCLSPTDVEHVQREGANNGQLPGALQKLWWLGAFGGYSWRSTLAIAPRAESSRMSTPRENVISSLSLLCLSHIFTAEASVQRAV